MNDKAMEQLDYHRILNEIADKAITKRAKAKIKASRPLTNKKRIEHLLEEVREAVQILNISSSVPIHSLDEMSGYLEQINKGLFLRPDQLTIVLSFLDHCRKLKRFMHDKEFAAPLITTYAWSIDDLGELEQEIARCLKHGQVDDHATVELAGVRKQLRQAKEDLKARAEKLAGSKKYQTYLQEKMMIEKNGHYTLPIKREYRSKVSGIVIDTSASGATVFIEPNELGTIQELVDAMQIAEDHEVQQVLYTLTGLIMEKAQEIQIAIDAMHQYDILFAKAKYGLELDGTIPQVNEEYRIDLREARHPMLGKGAVPLTVQLDGNDRALVITGPNTGGKTVTLKTVGLLSMMAATGLMIPVKEGSNLHLFHHIFVDMGDGQSIDENLSTFSSRLKNIIGILEETNEHTLVLLDELGSGTDPNEGMNLAQVIMEHLYEKGATMLATTHYSELKRLADTREGFINGSMEFDVETLKPTYKLLLGETGRSQAFEIALKLGMHPELVQRAYQSTYNKTLHHTIDTKQKSYEKQMIINKYARKKPLNKKRDQEALRSYDRGDTVRLSTTDELGIVYKGPDESGNYVVQVKGEKKTVNHKRLTLHVSANELYPEDYDFDIIFKSKEYRKKKHQMGRKHVEGLMIDEEE
ncbi:endonuclease MutS2 [Alkalihalophilus marmarensis]|uniref:endonuclease MutS2 n=1 Tax=Alkalihalophilus marmarensis TaxID=521377 RepID=UPI002E1C4925|nr:endonuclease MutS2 [Alkalihalophilus marmarensis]